MPPAARKTIGTNDEAGSLTDAALPAVAAVAAPARQWPVRLILVAIVFALVLPGLVFCGLLVDRLAAAERARSEQAVTAAALRAAEALDRELANTQTALLALATSGSLANNNMVTFRDKLVQVAAALGAPLLVSDTTGQQLLNTRVPAGTPLPRMAAQDLVRQVVATGRPGVSQLFTGATSNMPQLSVMVPVLAGNEVRAILALSLSTAHLNQLLQQQGLPPGWIASVVDGNDRILARTENASTFVGQFASPDFVLHATGDQELWMGTTVDGQEVLAASRRLRLANWRVGIGIRLASLEAPLRATLMMLIVTGAASLLVACALAWQLANSVTLPLQRLAGAGAALATGLPVLGVRSRIAEVDAVSRALVRATSDLRSRADALATERAQLAAVIETVPVGLVVADAPSGRLVGSNAQAEAIFRHGTQPDTGVDRYADWIAHHPDGRRVMPDEFPLAQVMRGANRAELQCLYRRGDGTDAWLQLVAAAVRNANGRVTGGVVAVTDIDELVRGREERSRWTEELETRVAERTVALEAANGRLRAEMDARAAAEEQLRQSQKMEAVGQLTGGIAHDFNNLLTVVMGSLDLLRRRVEDERMRRLVDNALNGATRAATLTAQLLAFSRRQPLKPQAVEPNELVTRMMPLLRSTLGEDATVETALAAGAWPVHADPNQVENALLNLAVNARDAIAAAGRHGGRLLIETGNAVLDAAALGDDRDAAPGDYVRLAVTDSGTGMPPDVVARVFEPFFTTKPVGQGTGLGLSQVHGFVKQSGGHVSIRTAPGKGTTVALFLPRMVARGEPDTAPELPAPEAARARPLQVLLVEDDEDVRRVAAEALAELGHSVTEAADAGGALDLLSGWTATIDGAADRQPRRAGRDTGPTVDVIVTDVALPGLDGVALAEAVWRHHPGLPVLFVSGYTGEDRRLAGRLPANAPLLPKPFTVQELAAKLQHVMGGAPGRT